MAGSDSPPYSLVMRWLISISILLTCVAAAPPEPAPRNTLDPAFEAHWVSFTRTPANQIRFSMTINGQVASAILDTGVSHSVVTPQFVVRAGLKAGSTGTAQTIGGAVNIAWTGPVSIQLGGLTRNGGRLAVTSLPSSATGGDAPIDALIGADILSSFALDIDYEANRFRLLRSGRMPFSGKRLPLALSAEGQTYISHLLIDGKPIGAMLVDTGDGGALTLTHAAWKRSSLASQPVSTTISFGLGGHVTNDITVARVLSINDLSVQNVEVRIEGNDGFSARNGMQGRIGSGLLQRYRVLLDPHAGQMILKTGNRMTTATDRSTSGLLLTPLPGRLQVLHVMRGSPAASSGWQSGEQICTLNGARFDSPDQLKAALTQLNGPAGSTIQLGMCDGAKRQLRLASFY